MPPPSISVPPTAAEGSVRFAAAHAILERAVGEKAFPGASYGVLHEGKVVALGALGRFTYDDSSPAVSVSTVYDLASLTKVLATTAVSMLLMDRGILKLEERLGDILPGFVIGMEPGSGKNRVTLQMLLAHSSGLPAYARLYEQHKTPEGMLRACLQMSLEAPPGTKAVYSDIGFVLLGKALEVLSGDLLARVFSREIATPLALQTMRYCPPRDWEEAIAPTEEDTWLRNRRIQGEVQDENCFVLGGASGHAGLFSNALDVLRFADCILRGGRIAGGRQLFKPETVERFGTRQKEPAGTTRALGWDTPAQSSSSGRYLSARAIGHLGYAGTSLWVDPEREVAIVLLTNRTWPDRANTAIQQVRPLFHDAVVEGLH